MRFSLLIGISLAACAFAAAQTGDQELAGRLANDKERGKAIEEIATRRSNQLLPLLLSWARNPPPQVDLQQLRIGLADAFGVLRATKAIPFLIENISLERFPRPNIWLKTPDIIAEHFPAVRALIDIGPDASEALIRTNWDSRPTWDRLAAIFAVARIKDPEAQAFLTSTAGEARLEEYWTAEGLKALHVLPSGSISGQLIGCEFRGYWWVRVVSMFGSQSLPTIGVKGDGTFSGSGTMDQSRYLIIVGKETEALKVVAADIQLERDNEIGLINLRGICPKK